MNQTTTTAAQRARRIARVRAKVKGTTTRPRLAVSRTLSHISAQIIDDTRGHTLLAASDREISAKKEAKKVERAFEVGKLIAERAKEKGIIQVVFDRRDRKYHGRVKALADGAREGGLQF